MAIAARPYKVSSVITWTPGAPFSTLGSARKSKKQIARNHRNTQSAGRREGRTTAVTRRYPARDHRNTQKSAGAPFSAPGNREKKKNKLGSAGIIGAKRMGSLNQAGLFLQDSAAGASGERARGEGAPPRPHRDPRRIRRGSRGRFGGAAGASPGERQLWRGRFARQFLRGGVGPWGGSRRQGGAGLARRRGWRAGRQSAPPPDPPRGAAAAPRRERAAPRRRTTPPPSPRRCRPPAPRQPCAARPSRPALPGPTPPAGSAPRCGRGAAPRADPVLDASACPPPATPHGAAKSLPDPR